ncbi:hypothetical protein GCM10023184_29590 [Flaviaesturariibacter amylovorans]|uniref:Uncharacterized protein n=1 Tax=Flaviaesturariibacter amylovorans TaxID=1084520 RepID=A0ABP8H6R1_9BACT
MDRHAWQRKLEAGNQALTTLSAGPPFVGANKGRDARKKTLASGIGEAARRPQRRMTSIAFKIVCPFNGTKDTVMPFLFRTSTSVAV